MTSGWSAHREQLAALFRALRERGQSETVGVALLTGIVLVLVAVLGLFLFADFGADDEEQLLANIEGDVQATNVTLSHEGGDTFDPENVEVVLTGDAEREFLLGDDFAPNEGDVDEFAPGDIWETEEVDDFILGEGRLLVIHEPTSTILLDQPYNIEQDGIELEIESYQGTMESESATIYGDDDGVEWDYDLFVRLGGAEYTEEEIDHDIEFNDVGPDLLAWLDDDHQIEASDPDGDSESAEIEATVEDDGEVVDTDTVDVTVTEAPTFQVSIDDVGTEGSVLSAGLGAHASGSIIEGETLAVEATVENTGGVEETQEITFSPGDLGSDQTETLTVDADDDETVAFTLDTSEGDAGSYTATVASEDDQATANVDVLQLPNFEVDILDTNSPVAEGDELSVDVRIENTGDVQDTQDIVAETSPFLSVIDDEEVTLDGGEETYETFTAETNEGDANDYLLNVSSDDDYEQRVVLVTNFDVDIVDVDDNEYGGTSGAWDAPEDADREGEFEVTVAVYNPADLDDGVEVSTDVVVDIDAATADDGSTKEFTFDEEGTESETWTFTADSDTGDEGATITATELGTSDVDSDEIDIWASETEVTSASGPDSISSEDDLSVGYNLANFGNYGGTASVFLFVEGTPVDEDLAVPVGSGDSMSGTLTHDAVDADPGDSLSWTVQVDDDQDGDTTEVSGTTEVDEVDDGDVLVEITETTDPVEPGDQFDVVTEVDLIGLDGVGANDLVSGTLSLEIAGLDYEETESVEVGLGGIERTFTVDTDAGDEGEYTAEASLVSDGDLLGSDTESVSVETANFDVEIDDYDASVDEGETVTVEYTVTNTAGVAGTQDVIFEVDGATEGTALDVALSAGETHEGQFSYATDSDDVGEITLEISTDDDSASRTITVQGAEDAQIVVADADGPNTIETGDDLNVDYTVENIGGEADEIGFVDLVPDAVGGFVAWDDYTGVELDPGDTVSGTLTWEYDDLSDYHSEGDTISYEIDLFEHDDSESDTTDYIGGGGGGPGDGDLEVTITDHPSQIDLGDDLWVEYTVSNTGDDSADGDTLELDVDEPFGVQDSETIAPLGPGDSTSGTLWYTSVESDYDGGETIAFTVELADDGAQDSATTQIAAVDPADLDIEITDIDPGTVDLAEGETETVTVDYDITNDGDQPATQVNVDFTIDGASHGSYTHNNIQPGDTESHSFEYTVTEGDVGDGSLLAQVDVVGESPQDTDEIDIQALRIVGHSISSTVHPYRATEEDDIAVTVSNEGSVGTSWDGVEDTVELYVDGDFFSDDEVDVELGAGETTTVYLEPNNARFGEENQQVEVELDNYDDSVSQSGVTFDIDGDLWVGSLQPTLEDDSEWCTLCWDPGWELDTEINYDVVNDGFDRASGAWGAWVSDDDWGVQWSHMQWNHPISSWYMERETWSPRPGFDYEAIHLAWHESNFDPDNPDRLVLEDDSGFTFTAFTVYNVDPDDAPSTYDMTADDSPPTP